MQLIGHVKPQFTLPIQQIFLQTLIETLGHIQTHLNKTVRTQKGEVQEKEKERELTEIHDVVPANCAVINNNICINH